MGQGHYTLEKWGLIWYTDGSKINKGNGAGVYGHGVGQRFSFSLGSTPWYFRPKYMPVMHVLMRILKGATIIGGSQDSCQ
jgi:hypothetical protein